MSAVLGSVKRFIIWMMFPVVRMYWRIAKPKTYGVKVVIEKSGKILLVRHSYQPHFWSFPGGSKKQNESAIGAAVRELSEELKMTPSNLLEVGVITSSGEGKQDTITVFSASAVGDPTIDNVELIEARWFSPSNLPNLGPTARRIYSCYNSREQ